MKTTTFVLLALLSAPTLAVDCNRSGNANGCADRINRIEIRSDAALEIDIQDQAA